MKFYIIEISSMIKVISRNFEKLHVPSIRFSIKFEKSTTTMIPRNEVTEKKVTKMNV